MANILKVHNSLTNIRPKTGSMFLNNLIKYKYFYAMLMPGLIYIIIFHYIPMAGLAIAFKNYKIFSGFWGSEWVGFENFQRLFTNDRFYRVLRNTFLISIYKISFGFPIPIIVAILVSEIKNLFFKRTVQTIMYLPHFFSWVVVSGLFFNLLSPNDGVINSVIKSFNGEPIFFLGSQEYFRSVLVGTDVWKETGWNAIIYIAALAGVPVELYEAGIIDGANRLQRILYISLPCILSTIIILFLLRLGNVLNAGFEQVLSMYNPAVYDVGDIIDTFTYRYGIIDLKFGFSTAVGLFKSFIACLLVLSANNLSKKVGQESLF